jgi:hypothetical protein
MSLLLALYLHLVLHPEGGLYPPPQLIDVHVALDILQPDVGGEEPVIAL